MANIKLVGNSWEAEGIFDKTQNKTQKAINSEVVSKLSGIEAGAQVNRTYTATTGKPTANQTPPFGGTATVSQVTQDATGQISVTDRTIEIPNSTASTSAAGLMSAADKTALDTAVTNIGTMSEMGTTATTLAGGIGELKGSLNDTVTVVPTYDGATDINSIVQAALARAQANSWALRNKLFSFRANYESGQPSGYFETSSSVVLCQFSSENYGCGLLLGDQAKNIASFRLTGGSITLFPIGDLQTYTTIMPTRGDDVSSATNFVNNYCRKWGKIVKYNGVLQSNTNTDVSVAHTKQIIKGLPKPDGALVFMCSTYRSSSSTIDRQQYRVQLNTDGTITAYWDNVVIPKNGEALLIDIVYMSND